MALEQAKRLVRDCFCACEASRCGNRRWVVSGIRPPSSQSACGRSAEETAFEDGYGASPSEVAATVEAAIAAGLAGIGIEDTTGDPSRPIRDFDDAVERVRQAAKAAKGRILLTGRTDNFIQGRPDLEDTIKRLVAFADVGADVLYAPYPPDMDAVRAIVKAVAPKPVNLVVGTMRATVPWGELQKAGVKRVSLGVALYTRVMGDLRKAAEQLADGDFASASAGMGFGEIKKMIADVVKEV